VALLGPTLKVFAGIDRQGGRMLENATRRNDMGSAEDLEALRKQHRDLEAKLEVMDRQLFLTAKEEAERARLKKQKLAIKDRIYLLLSHASAEQPAG
jgi:hypothetical protein